MAASPSRRARRITAAGAIALLVVGSVVAVNLRNEPAKADYLTPRDAQRALTRVTLMARSDDVTGIVLARQEAIVRVVRDRRIHTWVVRPGREAVETGSMASQTTLAPVRARDLDLAALVGRIRADDVGATCRPTALKAEIGVSAFPTAVAHVWCLDGARHAWLGPTGDRLADVDPRTPQGVAAGITDLRRFTGARHASYLAIRYGGTDAGMDLEVPGRCGDLAACDAIVASRRLRVESREPALHTREAPARLNYAQLIDLDRIDPARLHATVSHVAHTRKGLDWWRNLTVTLYQRPSQEPALEFAQGSTVFWTDLDGAERHY